MSEPEDRVINGRFRVGPLLGRGGVGSVRAGVDLETGEDVALKILELAADQPRARRQFFNEAALTQTLDHDGAVRVVDYGMEGSTCFIAMEMLDGKPLDAAVGSRALPVDEALHVMSQLCDVVHQAHERGFVHLDLKPANVLVIGSTARGPTIKLIDFGEARRLNRGVAPVEGDGIMGSPRYMPPERVLRHPPTRATDVYALGLIAYRLVAGRDAFDGDDLERVLRDQVQTPPPELGEEFGPFGHGVRGALEKDPARRFQSAADLREALREVQPEVEPPAIEARPRWPMVLAGIAVLVTLGGLVALAMG